LIFEKIKNYYLLDFLLFLNVIHVLQVIHVLLVLAKTYDIKCSMYKKKGKYGIFVIRICNTRTKCYSNI